MFLWMVNEIDDSGVDGGDGWTGSVVSAVFGVVSLVLGAEVAWMAGGEGALAIARPNPPKIDNGSEKSANQCSPVTQLNS